MVDDDAANIATLSEFLGNEFEVNIWHAGQDLLLLCNTYQPDIILIDISLSEIDGLKLCQQIKNTPDLQSAKIILFSSHNLIDDKLHGYMAGADDFLVKPIEHSELLMKMKVYSKLIKAEKHIAQMNKSLQKQVEMQTNKLMQSEKMASIGQLAAGVAHEINNPMCFIMTNLEALNDYINDLIEYQNSVAEKINHIEVDKVREKLINQQQALKEEYQHSELINDIKSMIGESLEGAERVTTIVKDLKTFARTDDRLEHIDLNQLLQKTLNMIWNQVKTKCELIKDFGSLKPMLGIETQLNQVFINLLINSSQSIDKKGIIHIKTESQSKWNIITISDNGCGIEKKVLDKIFDPFYTTKPAGVGTGLGLSISYAIIEKHQGRIEVDSTVGKGTTFTVYLPINQ